MRAGFFNVLLGMVTILFFVVSTVNGQGLDDIDVTVEMRNEPLESCFRDIEKQTGLLFAFLPDQVDVYTSMNLPKATRSISTTLDIVLKGTPLAYRKVDNSIVIFRKRNDDASRSPYVTKDKEETGSHTVKIVGNVTDSDGKPLSDVNVLTRNAGAGTTTHNGHYSLYAAGNDVLVFSFVGYSTVEIPVNGRTAIDLTLEREIPTLNEIEINAGYWHVKKREQTGNISRVAAEVISKQPVSNPLAALEGRMPGVYIQQNSGVPGGSITVQIRGINSLREDGNAPLFIIDGVPFTSNPMSSGLVGGAIVRNANPLNNINPADIESVEVLKDADATAIYGSRGANGVVLITTKKGKEGKTTFDINVYRGAGKVTRTMDLLNTQQWMEMRKEAFKNDGAVMTPFNAPDLLLWDTTRYTDWQKAFIGGTAQITNAQASLSGGDAYTQYFFSTGYYRESTVFPGDFAFRKGSAHFNFNHVTRDKKLNFALSANFSLTGSNLPKTDPIRLAMELAPNAPAILDEEGQLNWENSTWINPLALLRQHYKSNTDNIVTNATIGYQVLKGLEIKSNLGYTRMQVEEIQINPVSSFNPVLDKTGHSFFGNHAVNTWIIEPQAKYQRTIRSHGELEVLAGTTFQISNTTMQTILANGYTSDALSENLLAAADIHTEVDRYTQYRYSAVFGRINYNWKEKYIVNITGRRDGSSRFGPGRQFANFGAAGAAWIFTHEDFIGEMLPFLSFGKFRASYGITGSDQIGDYQYMDAYGSSAFTYDGLKGLVPIRLANQDYSWETNKKAEVGIELGFFENRILFSAAGYLNRSSRQLVGYSLPVITGQPSIQYNLPAIVQNTGLELTLNTANITNSILSWETSLNVTIPRNKLIDYPNLKGSPYEYDYSIGEPLSIIKKYHKAGVDPATGVYTFEDKDGDGILSVKDYQGRKKITQDVYGGIQNSIRFRSLRLDFFLQVVRQTGKNYLGVFLVPPGNRFSNQPVLVMDRWRQPGDVTSIQRFTQRSGNVTDAYRDARIESDYFVGDASFVRLKNLSLSWDLNPRWLEKINCREGRLYVQGQNLLTFTRYQGYDPESQASGALPPLRVLTAGLQFTF